MSNRDKPRILYIMGIDWDWIFQRPQIIEQHLEKDNNVTVVFPRSILKLLKRRHLNYPERYRILWTLPLQEKIKAIGAVHRLLNRHVFRDIREHETTVIGFPLYYRYIPRDYSGTLIYDCMDNHESLYSYYAGVPELLRQGKLLMARSHLVFVSSQRLMEKLQRYDICPMPRMVLLRNGAKYPSKLPSIAQPVRPEVSQMPYKIGYIGTVAEWFDRDLILESLRQIRDIEYHLIGPVNITLPQHESRLIMEGIVSHEHLYDTVGVCVCLVMPFKVNETVLYVDPVKLYEYIVMGKCILSVFYPEIERFEDFVYFYHSTWEYIQLLQQLKKQGFPPKYTSRQRQDFLVKNSWDARFDIWDNAVKDLRQ